MNEQMNKEAAEALDTLFGNVYVPVFVKQCAEFGMPIETEEDLATALNNVRMLKEAGVTSAPTGGNKSIHKAAAELLSKSQTPGNADVDTKAAIDALSQIPYNESVIKAAQSLTGK